VDAVWTAMGQRLRRLLRQLAAATIASAQSAHRS
jgi:hypothetical protein